MGMPITLEVIDELSTQSLFDEVYAYFASVDERFSTYKENSEISLINRGKLGVEEASADMQTIFALAKQTREETSGYFDIQQMDGVYDPSGIVKGWSIFNATKILLAHDCQNFYVEAGGDTQVHGYNQDGQNWRIGIRNPFNFDEIVKVLSVPNYGVATSGTYIRGQHIYNPHNWGQTISEILSLTVIGPDIYEADRFATAAFAMGRKGIFFIEGLEGFEGYMIDENKRATFTSGFERHVLDDATHR